MSSRNEVLADKINSSEKLFKSNQPKWFGTKKEEKQKCRETLKCLQLMHFTV